MTIPGALLDGSRATGRRFVAGIDGGATKTVAAVLSLDTFDLRFGHSGPSNVDAAGVVAAVSAIRESLREALGEAGVAADAVGTAVIGLAGTPSDELAHSVQADFGLGAWYFVNDVIAAWASGTWLEPGVAVISGTGSHVFGVNAAGASWRTGGWGHILGDEGSGFWLGLHGMKVIPGLSAAVYTQLTDVEGERDGWLTYDRAVLKVDPAVLRAAHQDLIAEPVH